MLNRFASYFLLFLLLVVIGHSGARPIPSHGTTRGAPQVKRASFVLENGMEAQDLNFEFKSTAPGDSCTEDACVNGQFAKCNFGQYVLMPCGPTLQCYALPLVLSSGTSITCTTESDAVARIAATGASGGLTGCN